MALSFVDVSHHDLDRNGGPLDWSRIIAATSPVMVAKLSESDAYVDTYGAVAIRDARKAGASLVGGYHCLASGNVPAQIDRFRALLDQAGAGWAMLDVEPFSELGSRWPRLDDVRRAEDAWYAKDSRPLALYIPRWFWARTASGWGGVGLSGLRGPMVSSHYGPNAALDPAALYQGRAGNSGPGWTAYGGKTPAIWQYGSRCRVPGASDQTDINAWRGTLAELTALLIGGDMALSNEDVTRIAQATANQLLHGDADSGPRVISAGTAILGGFDRVVDLTASVAELRGQVAGLTTLVQQALTAPAAPLTPEQLQELTTAVSTAAAAPVEQLRAQLATAAQAEADALAHPA